MMHDDTPAAQPLTGGEHDYTVEDEAWLAAYRAQPQVMLDHGLRMSEMERELVARGNVPFYDEQGNLMGWGAPWAQPRPLPSATVAAWTAYTVGALGFMALAAVLINGWPA